MSRRLTPDQLSARRNRQIVRRNDAIRAELPLFAVAGILDQVADLAVPDWTAQRVIYDQLGREIASYEFWLCRYRDAHRRLAVYRAMLAELVGPDIADAIELAFRQFHHITESQPYLDNQLGFLLSWFNTEIARLSGCTPILVFEECRRRSE